MSTVYSSHLNRKHKKAICKSNAAFNDTGNHLIFIESQRGEEKELVDVSDKECIKLPPLFA